MLYPAAPWIGLHWIVMQEPADTVALERPPSTGVSPLALKAVSS